MYVSNCNIEKNAIKIHDPTVFPCSNWSLTVVFPAPAACGGVADVGDGGDGSSDDTTAATAASLHLHS